MDSDEELEFQSNVLHYFVWKAELEPLPDDMNRFQRLADQMQEDFPELGNPPSNWKEFPPEIFSQLHGFSKRMEDLKKERDVVRSVSIEYRFKYEQILKQYNDLTASNLVQQQQSAQTQQRNQSSTQQKIVPASSSAPSTGSETNAAVLAVAPSVAAVNLQQIRTGFSWLQEKRAREDSDAATRAKKRSRKSKKGGPVKADRDYTFEERILELEAYKKEHGDCNVPKSGTTISLAKWVIAIRATYQLCKRHPACMKLPGSGPYFLDEERIARLEAMGIGWEAKEKSQVSFELRFEQLLIYKQLHGHLRVGASDKDFGDLGTWVKMMRRHKRENKKTFLEGDRYQRLCAVGFEWKTRDEPKSFEERLKECREFREAYGHLDVPKLPPVFQVVDGQTSKGATEAESLVVSKEEESSDGKPAAKQDSPAAVSQSISVQNDVAVEQLDKERVEKQEDDSKPAAQKEVSTSKTSTSTRNEGENLIGVSNAEPTGKQDGGGKSVAHQDAASDNPLTINQGDVGENASEPKPEKSDSKKSEEKEANSTNAQKQNGLPEAKTVILSKQEYDFRRWAEKCRDHYWKFQFYGQRKVLNDERIEKLNELGFVWGEKPDSKVYEGGSSHRDEIIDLASEGNERIHRASEKLFLDHVEKLKQCKEKHGTCMDRIILQGMFPDDTALLNWHQKMKKAYKDLQAGKKSYLTHRRAEKLKAVGYVFEGRHLRKHRNSKPKPPKKRKPGKMVQMAAAALLHIGAGNLKDPPASAKAPPEQAKTDLSPTRVSARIKEKKESSPLGKKAPSSKRGKRNTTADASPRKKAKNNKGPGASPK